MPNILSIMGDGGEGVHEACHVVVEKVCCGTCVHYRQHYVLSEEGRFLPLWYGHCHVPRAERRTPEEVCRFYAAKENAEDRV